MKEFSQFVNSLSKDWTLFLDRDGVINKRLPDEYVKSIEEFDFLEGVTESLQILSKIFGRIIVISNQQGIGKKLMTIETLDSIHNQMITDVSKDGGRIDKVYFCPDLAHKPDNYRKPNSEMAFQAKKDFPEIDFNKSLMIGDSASDIEFGKRLQMKTIFIGKSSDSSADFEFSSLLEFTQMLVNELDSLEKKGSIC